MSHEEQAKDLLSALMTRNPTPHEVALVVTCFQSIEQAQAERIAKLEKEMHTYSDQCGCPWCDMVRRLHREKQALSERISQLERELADVTKAGTPFWKERDTTNAYVVENAQLREALEFIATKCSLASDPVAWPIAWDVIARTRQDTPNKLPPTESLGSGQVEGERGITPSLNDRTGSDASSSTTTTVQAPFMGGWRVQQETTNPAVVTGIITKPTAQACNHPPIVSSNYPGFDCERCGIGPAPAAQDKRFSVQVTVGEVRKGKPMPDDTVPAQACNHQWRADSTGASCSECGERRTVQATSVIQEATITGSGPWKVQQMTPYQWLVKLGDDCCSMYSQSPIQFLVPVKQAAQALDEKLANATMPELEAVFFPNDKKATEPVSQEARTPVTEPETQPCGCKGSRCEGWCEVNLNDSGEDT